MRRFRVLEVLGLGFGFWRFWVRRSCFGEILVSGCFGFRYWVLSSPSPIISPVPHQLSRPPSPLPSPIVSPVSPSGDAGGWGFSEAPSADAGGRSVWEALSGDAGGWGLSEALSARWTGVLGSDGDRWGEGGVTWEVAMAIAWARGSAWGGSSDDDRSGVDKEDGIEEGGGGGG